MAKIMTILIMIMFITTPAPSLPTWLLIELVMGTRLKIMAYVPVANPMKIPITAIVDVHDLAFCNP